MGLAKAEMFRADSMLAATPALRCRVLRCRPFRQASRSRGAIENAGLARQQCQGYVKIRMLGFPLTMLGFPLALKSLFCALTVITRSDSAPTAPNPHAFSFRAEPVRGGSRRGRVIFLLSAGGCRAWHRQGQGPSRFWQTRWSQLAPARDLPRHVGAGKSSKATTRYSLALCEPSGGEPS